MPMYKKLHAHYLKTTSLCVHKMLQNITSTRRRKIGGLSNYQSGGNFKKGEGNFERGVSDPLGHYAVREKRYKSYVSWNTLQNVCLFCPNSSRTSLMRTRITLSNLMVNDKLRNVTYIGKCSLDNSLSDTLNTLLTCKRQSIVSGEKTLLEHRFKRT